MIQETIKMDIFLSIWNKQQNWKRFAFYKKLPGQFHVKKKLNKQGWEGDVYIKHHGKCKK